MFTRLHCPHAFVVTCLVDLPRYIIRSSICDARMSATFPSALKDALCELSISHL